MLLPTFVWWIYSPTRCYAYIYSPTRCLIQLWKIFRPNKWISAGHLNRVCFCCLFGIVYMFYTIGSQFNATSGLGTPWTWRWRQSYIYSSSPCAGPRQGTHLGRKRLPTSTHPRTVWAFPRSHVIPVLCFLFHQPQWPVNSTALLSPGGFQWALRRRRRAASGCWAAAKKGSARCRQGRDTSAPARLHCETVAWFLLSIVCSSHKRLQLQCSPRSCIKLRARPFFEPQPLWAGMCPIPVPEPQACHSQAEALPRVWASCLSPSFLSPYPPTNSLCSFQLTARLHVCLLTGMRSLSELLGIPPHLLPSFCKLKRRV